MVDRHVVKMCLETAQLLSTAHRFLDGKPVDSLTKTGRKTQAYVLPDERESVMYKITHFNHPSAVWTRSSIENYWWLVEHFYALLNEYTRRFNKQHKCFEMAFYLQSPPKQLEQFDWTPMPSCMDDKYIVSKDPIINYRNYYKVGKSHLHAWKTRQPPEWIVNNDKMD